MSARPVERQLIEVLRELPFERQTEILDFALFLREREQIGEEAKSRRRLTLAKMREAFADVSSEEIEREVSRAIAEVRAEYPVEPSHSQR